MQEKIKDDAISRQAAIALVNDHTFYDDYDDTDKNCLIDGLRSLPPAQPEIIRCEDCKHGVHTGCGNTYLCVVSPENRLEHRYDFWCAYAERRTDE